MLEKKELSRVLRGKSICCKKRSANKSFCCGVDTITKAEWENPYGQPQGTAEYSYDWQEAFPAEEFLRDIIRRFIELEWIPWSGLFEWEGEILEPDGPYENLVPHVSLSSESLLIF